MTNALHIAAAIGAVVANTVAPIPTTSHATIRHLMPEGCTVAEPVSQATLEIQMAYAEDFCELVSHALAGDVFHVPLVVTPGRIWHYPAAAITCRLHYRGSRDRVTVRNSLDTCDWFARHTTNWKQDAPTRPAPPSRLKGSRAAERRSGGGRPHCRRIAELGHLLRP